MEPFKGKTCDDAVRYIIVLAGKYKECAARHTALAKVVE